MVGLVVVFPVYALVGLYFAIIRAFRALGCSCWVLAFRGCMGLLGGLCGVVPFWAVLVLLG